MTVDQILHSLWIIVAGIALTSMLWMIFALIMGDNLKWKMANTAWVVMLYSVSIMFALTHIRDNYMNW